MTEPGTASPHVCMLIDRDEYPLFRSALPPDRRLPAAFEDWEAAGAAAALAARGQGRSVAEVVVRHGAFMRYCGRIGLPPTYTLLDSYARQLVPC